MLDGLKSTPEISVTVSDGFASATVEVFDARPDSGDRAYPTRIILRHDGEQLSSQGWRDLSPRGAIFYVRGSWEVGDLERLFMAAIRAIRLAGLPQSGPTGDA